MRKIIYIVIALIILSLAVLFFVNKNKKVVGVEIKLNELGIDVE